MEEPKFSGSEFFWTPPIDLVLLTHRGFGWTMEGAMKEKRDYGRTLPLNESQFEAWVPMAYADCFKSVIRKRTWDLGDFKLWLYS